VELNSPFDFELIGARIHHVQAFPAKLRAWVSGADISGLNASEQ
jgi:hypothetical protein